MSLFEKLRPRSRRTLITWVLSGAFSIYVISVVWSTLIPKPCDEGLNLALTIENPLVKILVCQGEPKISHEPVARFLLTLKKSARVINEALGPIFEEEAKTLNWTYLAPAQLGFLHRQTEVLLFVDFKENRVWGPQIPAPPSLPDWAKLGDAYIAEINGELPTATPFRLWQFQ